MPPPSHRMDVSRCVSSEELYWFTAASHFTSSTYCGSLSALPFIVYALLPENFTVPVHCPHASRTTECFLPCLQLAKQGALNLKTIRHFIIDECDKVLENIGECVLKCNILLCFTHCHRIFSYEGALDKYVLLSSTSLFRMSSPSGPVTGFTAVQTCARIYRTSSNRRRTTSKS